VPEELLTSSSPTVAEVTNLDSDVGRQVIAIYEQSFPEAERD